MSSGTKDFSAKSFWDARFETETNFEWLTSAETLVARVVTASSAFHEPSILHIGSGTSMLSNALRANLALDPVRITNLDYSPAAVERGSVMELQQFGNVRMRWRVADLLDVNLLRQTIPRGSAVQIIVEKSCADAISCGVDATVKLSDNSCVAVPPTVALAVNLARISQAGAKWIALSYSKHRFDFVKPDSEEFSSIGGKLWRIVETSLVEPEVSNVTTLQKIFIGHVVYEPKIYHTLFILERTDEPICFLKLILRLEPLFRYGHKNTLEIENLYKLDRRLQVKELADKFEELWRLEADQYQNDLRLLKAISDIGFSSAPLLLQALISYITQSSTGTTSVGTGIGYAIGIFIISMISSICFGNFFQRTNKYGMIVRGTLTAVVYRKALRLSGTARQEFNAGRITNIISTDLVRLDAFMVNFHLAWSYPLQVTYTIALLLTVLGVSSLSGVFVLLATLPLQVYIIRALVNLRKQNVILTDQRVRLISEILSSIRIIKFFAWENSFLDRVAAIRTEELKAVISANLIRSIIIACGFALPVLAASTSFMVYFVVSPAFDPVSIFTALALFNNLRTPIQWTPIAIGAFADAKVAVERIEALLESAELDFEPTYNNDADVAVSVANGDFRWDATPMIYIEDDDASKNEIEIANEVEAITIPGSISSKDIDRLSRTFESLEQVVATASTTETMLEGKKLTLNDINISIPKGSLVAIVGSVGSGKSSLLSALIGQLKPSSNDARVVFSGSVGYAPQQPWIMNDSLKENILFGKQFDENKYRSAIYACALTKDLEVLSGGDAVEIGEKGINLSGGQKARVSMARLVYYDADIMLMDDPLSAVDAHVGRHIFEYGIKTAMKKKTRLLVTHQLHFVSQCDLVLTMKDGKVAEFGSYKTLMANRRDFYELMNSYGSVPTESEIDLTAKKLDLQKHEDIAPVIKPQLVGVELVKEEERGEGNVKNHIFYSFGIAMGGSGFLLLMLGVLIVTQSTKVLNDVWLVLWSSTSFANLSDRQYLFIYLGFGLLQAALMVLFSILIAVGGTRAASNLHKQALNRIIHAPIRFFDTNPLGRVLNRFSKDQDVIDNTLIDGIRLFLITFGTAISTFILVAYVSNGWFLILLAVLMGVYYYFQAIYRANARELKRLDAVTRSPLYAHISESMTGVATIRAYREQDRFIEKTDKCIDINNTPYYLQVTGARWLGIRLEIIGNILILFTALFGVFARSTINPSLFGLALSYVLQVTQLLSLCIRQFTDAEVQLVSIERLNYYARIVNVEPPGIIDSFRPPVGWPSQGKIKFENLSMRYQAELPLVLKNINLEIHEHEKIGVVGRTGSGKSSLMLALFRILEPDSGSVSIDSLDISKLGLKDLRRNLSIIPQDPILFSGTIRSNLDPFEEHNDLNIWDALESSGIKVQVMGMDGGLNATVDALGENLSVGQRQLVCLARAILRKPKLIVLDECTANVDLETDHFIQRTLRENMKDATILTIAHRLNTVMDCDRIIVLDSGKVVQFDTPRALLLQEGGAFHGMVRETGAANEDTLHGITRTQKSTITTIASALFCSCSGFAGKIAAAYDSNVNTNTDFTNIVASIPADDISFLCEHLCYALGLESDDSVANVGNEHNNLISENAKDSVQIQADLSAVFSVVNAGNASIVKRPKFKYATASSVPTFLKFEENKNLLQEQPILNDIEEFQSPKEKYEDWQNWDAIEPEEKECASAELNYNKDAPVLLSQTASQILHSSQSSQFLLATQPPARKHNIVQKSSNYATPIKEYVQVSNVSDGFEFQKDTLNFTSPKVQLRNEFFLKNTQSQINTSKEKRSTPSITSSAFKLPHKQKSLHTPHASISSNPWNSTPRLVKSEPEKRRPQFIIQSNASVRKFQKNPAVKMGDPFNFNEYETGKNSQKGRTITSSSFTVQSQVRNAHQQQQENSIQEGEIEKSKIKFVGPQLFQEWIENKSKKMVGKINRSGEILEESVEDIEEYPFAWKNNNEWEDLSEGGEEQDSAAPKNPRALTTSATAQSPISGLTVVIKLGTSSIVSEKTLFPKMSSLSLLVETVQELRQMGHRIVIVSSGAVGMGLKRLGLNARPNTLAMKQACAAVGQGRLMALYDDLFGQLDIPVAQVLLTKDCLSERAQYLNACNTFTELLKFNTVPIVNENDAVSSSGIRFGDNDTLSAITAGMVNADFLFLCTDVECLYTDNPRTNPDAKPVRIVEDISSLKVSVASVGSSLGTGGMATKLIAAELATAAGCSTIITIGSEPRRMITILNEMATHRRENPATPFEPSTGTLFVRKPNPMMDRKWWILHGLADHGCLYVDEGAARALRKKKSLFAAGIVDVTGNFSSDQAIKIVCKLKSFGVNFETKEEEIARGIVNYSSSEILRIKGCKSYEIHVILGYVDSDCVIHRDNMALI
ncbi:hypothetical protein HK100_002155 [Physocladia obscura]|uniref:Uncharacterized protein n=1 Tax=Physocladia obscura TaxID=109957 RepID=A0AAD5T855_9FUNG|nr:hypothetical protein HK100_002155 [Physocladia obscura]